MTPAVAAAPENAENPRASNNLGRDAEVQGEQARTMAFGQKGGLPRHVLRRWRPTWWQQLIRALIHTFQFVVAYFLMLLGEPRMSSVAGRR